MGCGASLKVTAIVQPTNKKELAEENHHFRVTRFKFKLPAEVLQGFADTLNIITRKPEKRHRPQIAEPSEVSMDQLLSSQVSHEPLTQVGSSHQSHQKNHRFSLPDPVVPPKEERVIKAASLKQQAVPAIESAYSKDASPGLEVEDLSDTGQVQAAPLAKQQTIETQVMHAEKQQSMFTRVEEPQVLDENELLSPEASRVLPEEEESKPDLSAQRFARQERDKQAQEEAERLAQAKRQQAEAILDAQKGEMAKMEDAAHGILSKYQ